MLLGDPPRARKSFLSKQDKDVEYIKHLREYLANKNKAAASKQRSVEKQILKLNDASKARIFRPVPCRVSSAVKGPKVMGYSFISVCDRADSDSDVILAQSCDVLGPYACSDCIKRKFRNKYTEETVKCFPELAVNQRVLCSQSRMKYMLNQNRENFSPNFSRSRRRHQNIEDVLIEKHRKIPRVPSFTRVVTDNEVHLRVMEDVRHRPEEKPSFLLGRRRPAVAKVKKSVDTEHKDLLGPILVDTEKETNRKSWNVRPPSIVN